jgi:hypothetical protein
MSHWWSSKSELILVQIWVVLILSHLVYALRERIALVANCDPFEVSVPRYGGSVASAWQLLSAPARPARAIGSAVWPPACELAPGAGSATGKAFMLSASTA